MFLHYSVPTHWCITNILAKVDITVRKAEVIQNSLVSHLVLRLAQNPVHSVGNADRVVGVEW